MSGLEGLFEHTHTYIYMSNLSLGQACLVLALGAQRS